MNELTTRSNPDATVYAVVRNSAAQVWNGSAFVTYADADYGTYDVPLTEQGTSSGFYVGSFPTAITGAGTYLVEFFRQVGGSPSEASDVFIDGGTMVWDGSGEAVESGDTLCSLSYAKLSNNITTSAKDAVLTNMLAAATNAIQNYCGRIFFARDYVEYHDAVNSYTLVLRQRPINSVSQVTLDPNGSSPEVITGSQYVVNATRGTIQLKRSSPHTAYFGNGYQDQYIKAEYNAGYTTIPDALQYACAALVGDMYQLSLQNRTVQSERIGDYAITYRQNAQKLLNGEVSDILESGGYVETCF